MFEKNLRLACLLDFYGEVLSERKQSVLSLYYNEDLSLAEIAEEIGISRQGVRELIKKAEEELLFFEEKLGLEKKFNQALNQSQKVFSLMESEGTSEALKGEMQTLVQRNMFQSLSDKLNNAFKKFRSKGKLTEADVKAGMREIKLALLEADVNFKVVKDFINTVSARAVGGDVLESLMPA